MQLDNAFSSYANVQGSIFKDIVNLRLGILSQLLCIYYYRFNDVSTMEYQVFGAAMAEAEVDLLTGQHKINRVDVVIDLGERYIYYVYVSC